MFEGTTYQDGSAKWQVKNLLEPKNIIYSQSGKGGLSQRNVGEVIFSAMPLVDANLHLLDGALIQGNGIYADFVNYVASIFAPDSPSFYHSGYVLEKFDQPTLTNYNMIGGDHFAVFSEQNSDYGANGCTWKMFDGVTTTNFQTTDKVLTNTIVIYNPVELRITQLEMTNITSANYHFTDYEVYGSIDGKNWIKITEGTNTISAASGVWTINMSSNYSYYKWYKFFGQAPTNRPGLSKIDITATKLTGGSFTQPTLTADYPTGLDQFAVWAEKRLNDSTYPAWKGVDGNTATYCVFSATHTNGPQNYYFYNPTPLCVKSLRFSTYAAQNFSEATLYGYNESSETWVEIGSDTNPNINAASLYYTLNFNSNTGFYKTYRISFTGWHAAKATGFGELYIDAYTQVYKTASELYFDDLKKYGCAGKFVYDSTNNTVRLPKLNGLIAATTDDSKHGTVVRNDITDLYTSLYGTGLTLYSDFVNTNFNELPSPQYMNYYAYIVLANSDAANAVELNIGRLVNDINNKVDKNNMVEASVVIETYVGSLSWYRLYSDGWVEQGGTFDTLTNAYQDVSITFLKPFKDTKYFACPVSAYHADIAKMATIRHKTTTEVIFHNVYNYSTVDAVNYPWANWYACGYSAGAV